MYLSIKTYSFIFFLIYFTSQAQFEVWSGLGIDAGVPVSAQYSNERDILKPHFSKTLNGNLYAQVRFFKRIGIEGYCTQNFQKYVYEDLKFYKSTGNKYEGLIKVRNNFYSLGANFIYRQPIVGSYAGIYGSLGYRINHTGNQEVTEIQTFKLNSQIFEFKAKSLGTGSALLFEAGCQIITDDEKNMFTIGLQFHNGLSNLYQGDFTSQKDSTVFYTDKVVSKLSSFNLTFKYHYRLYYYDKSEKIIEEEPTPDEIKKHQDYVHPSQRKLEKKDSIIVKTKKIIIDLYEPYQEDNDRVSILLNNRVVLDNFTVMKKHHQFEVELYPGVNQLVFQAENLGDIPPNTANIFVIENGKKKMFDMKANLNTSQMLIINYTP